MSQLNSVRIQRFKAIEDAPFDLASMNLLVGANNAGKSSVIQGLHFGIGLLQTILLTGNWGEKDSISTSVNPTQLIYSPSDDVNSLAMGGKLLEKSESAISLQFGLASGEQPTVSVRKGRNRNILVTVTAADAAKRLASLERPFSVFSPGLAGISKTEQHVSDGVLLRTIARGDANLVLRNILLRLWDTPEWDGFVTDLRAIFPAIDFDISFDQKTDEFIDVRARVTQELLPLELVGTGVLQAIQILSYIHRFSPSLVVLDEPDSHLHPNNQRLLCALLRRVADERNTQILLTSHSRHVVDAIGDTTAFLWVRNGTVERASLDDQIGVLLDIGALDVKERVSHPNIKAVILTEDTTTRALEILLQSSGFDEAHTALLPYYGISTIKQLRPLVQMIRATNPKAKVILHRDRDYLTEAEVANWQKQIRALKVEPFVTAGVDVESHLLNARHLAQLNPQYDEEQFDRLLEAARAECESDSIRHYVNGRIDIQRRDGTHGSIDHGKLALEARDQVGNDLKRYSHGKTVLKALRRLFREESGRNLKDLGSSAHAEVEELRVLAKALV